MNQKKGPKIAYLIRLRPGRFWEESQVESSGSVVGGA